MIGLVFLFGAACAAFLIIFGWRSLRLAGSAAPLTPCQPSGEYLPISVLIPAWLEANTLPHLMQALNRVEYPAAWEVIIIAGGKDGTHAAARTYSAQATYPLIVLEQRGLGKNDALQTGLGWSMHPIIVILDADTEIAPDWLTALVCPLLNGARAACGNFYPFRETWVSALEQMEKISAYEIHRSVILQGSGSIAVYRDELERAGGFPADVKVGVDWDLDIRLSRLNTPKAFARAARVITDRPATLTEYWQNEKRWRRAHLHSLWKQCRDLARNPIAAAGILFIYGLAFALFTGLPAALICALLGWDELALTLAAFTLILAAWVIGWRGLLALKVARYTRESRWLRLVWVPGMLMFVTFAASWAAAMTLNRLSPHFKGPRGARTS